MTYEKVKNLNPEEFKRFCGVYPETFKDMVKVLAAEKVLQKKSGRPSKLSGSSLLFMLNQHTRCQDNILLTQKFRKFLKP
jgi:hypothetical protein